MKKTLILGMSIGILSGCQTVGGNGDIGLTAKQKDIADLCDRSNGTAVSVNNGKEVFCELPNGRILNGAELKRAHQ